MQGSVDLPQPVWGDIFLVLAAALLVGLILNDPRKDPWLRRFRRLWRDKRE